MGTNTHMMRISGMASQCAAYGPGPYVCTDEITANSPTIIVAINMSDGQANGDYIDFADAKISAQGLNDGYGSTYAFLQILNVGRRYMLVQGQVIDIIVLNPNCLDSGSNDIYFSQVAVSAGRQFKLEMNDIPSTQKCNFCYYDPGTNQQKDIDSLVAIDNYTAYLVRKIDGDGSDAPLKAAKWGYKSITTRVNGQYNVQTLQRVNNVVDPDIPTYTSACHNAVELVSCEFRKTKRCWGPKTHNSNEKAKNNKRSEKIRQKQSSPSSQL